LAVKATVANAKKWAALSGLLCAGFSVSTVLADVMITVNNPSFETLPSGGLPFGCGSGCSYSSATTAIPIPGWTASGGENTQVGQFQPGTNSGNFQYFNSIPDGNTVAYSNGGSISQTVGQTVELGVVYTLQVDLGLRNDLPDPGFIELLIGNNAPIVATPETTAPPTGGWSTYIATYTGLSKDVGDSITIDFARCPR
jgi:hapalindole biogenesis HpiC1 cyclase-like protein